MFCHANFKSSGAENWIYIRLTGLIFSGAGKFLCLIMCIVISCTCLIYLYTHVNSELFWQFLCFTILYWQEQEMMYGMRWRTSLTLNDITCSNLKTSHNKIKKNKKNQRHKYFSFLFSISQLMPKLSDHFVLLSKPIFQLWVAFNWRTKSKGNPVVR